MTKSYHVASNVILIHAPSLQVQINVGNNGKLLSPKNVLRGSRNGKRTEKSENIVQSHAKFAVRKLKNVFAF